MRPAGRSGPDVLFVVLNRHRRGTPASGSGGGPEALAPRRSLPLLVRRGSCPTAGLTMTRTAPVACTENCRNEDRRAAALSIRGPADPVRVTATSLKPARRMLRWELLGRSSRRSPVWRVTTRSHPSSQARLIRAAKSAFCAPWPRCSGRVPASPRYAVESATTTAAAPAGSSPSSARKQCQPLSETEARVGSIASSRPSTSAWKRCGLARSRSHPHRSSHRPRPRERLQARALACWTPLACFSVLDGEYHLTVAAAAIARGLISLFSSPNVRAPRPTSTVRRSARAGR